MRQFCFCFIVALGAGPAASTAAAQGTVEDREEVVACGAILR